MERKEWFTRKFGRFEDNGTLPGIIERLAGTPARLEEKVKRIVPTKLDIKPDGKWSIKEEIGHLIDLEPLWSGRLDDFKEGKEELRPADLSNRKTHEADHNSKNIEDLLSEFRTERQFLLSKIKAFNDEDVDRTALHPRLKSPMKLIDLAYFVAEHDDHHLARITELS